MPPKTVHLLFADTDFWYCEEEFGIRSNRYLEEETSDINKVTCSGCLNHSARLGHQQPG